MTRNCSGPELAWVGAIHCFLGVISSSVFLPDALSGEPRGDARRASPLDLRRDGHRFIAVNRRPTSLGGIVLAVPQIPRRFADHQITPAALAQGLVDPAAIIGALFVCAAACGAPLEPACRILAPTVFA